MVVTTRTASELNRTADAVRATGGVALPVVADLTDPDSVDAMVAATLDEFGAIDVLVNAAGRMSPIGVPLWESDPHDWTLTLRTDVELVFLTCRAVVPVMLQQGQGKIFNLTSPASSTPVPEASAYCASKAATEHLSAVLAAELAGTGVTSNSINIGATDTPVFREVIATLYPHLPHDWVDRWGRDPVEAAAMVVYLCTRAGDGVNGQSLPWSDGWIRRGVQLLSRDGAGRST